MIPRPYVELHARSAFSFLQGASVPEEYAQLAAEYGYAALALLDFNGFYGSPRFHMAAQKAGLRAHIGAEISCTDGARYPLLVKNRTGYQNLCKLVTRMKMRVAKNEPTAATHAELAEFAEGLVCLTGDEAGPLALALQARNGRACLEQIIQIYGKANVYAEVQRHFDRDQEARNEATIALARSLRVPLLATGGVCHARPAQRQILDVFTCLYHKTTLAEAGRLLAKNSARHLRRPEEMARLFADLPDAVANTQGVSAKLNFTLSDLGYQFPEYPVPHGETQMSFLRKRTDEGARRRYRPYHDRARAQIERELALIEKLNLPGYFLIVWDIVNFCRDNGILVQIALCVIRWELRRWIRWGWICCSNDFFPKSAGNGRISISTCLRGTSGKAPSSMSTNAMESWARP
jgi:error-prone DNA polymerase